MQDGGRNDGPLGIVEASSGVGAACCNRGANPSHMLDTASITTMYGYDLGGCERSCEHGRSLAGQGT